MDDVTRLLADPAAWAALATLIAMEVVLGVDNLVFIALLSNRVEESRRAVRAVCRLVARPRLPARAARLGGGDRAIEGAAGDRLRARLFRSRSRAPGWRPVPGLEGDRGNSRSRRSARGERRRGERAGARRGLGLVQIVCSTSSFPSIALSPPSA